jgi:hypothetical protein
VVTNRRYFRGASCVRLVQDAPMGRTILLTGAMGTGKSTLLALSATTRAAHLGKTAAIDADLVSMMVDPTFELPDEERHLDLSGYQCWLLAQSFLRAGFEPVLIGSNGFHTPEEGLNDMIAFLLTAGDVHHVTLDPSLDEIQRRMARRGSDLDRDSIAAHVAWMRGRQRAWTCRIDNTAMSPEATLAEIAARVGRGEGRLTGPLPTTS